VPGGIGVVGAASRFVAYDALSIFKMHRLDHAVMTNQVKSSLESNCTVLVVELETK
jgi:hypothetical protein